MRDEGGKAQPLFLPGITLHFQIYFLLNILGLFYYHLLKSYIYWLEYLEIQDSFLFLFFLSFGKSDSHRVMKLERRGRYTVMPGLGIISIYHTESS